MHVLSVRLREIFLKPAQPVLILHDPSLYRALLLALTSAIQLRAILIQSKHS